MFKKAFLWLCVQLGDKKVLQIFGADLWHWYIWLKSEQSLCQQGEAVRNGHKYAFKLAVQKLSFRFEFLVFRV